MPAAYCPHRHGQYVYDVTVTTDETVRSSRRYRAHLSNAETLENGRLTPAQVMMSDTYGPTVMEAMRALDASFETWRFEQVSKRQCAGFGPAPSEGTHGH